MSEQTDGIGKKRNRIPSSCSVCRKRKSKCDRVRPICGSCKKKSIAHLCFYEPTSHNQVTLTDTKVMFSIPPPPTGAPIYRPVYPLQPQQQQQQFHSSSLLLPQPQLVSPPNIAIPTLDKYLSSIQAPPPPAAPRQQQQLQQQQQQQPVTIQPNIPSLLISDPVPPNSNSPPSVPLLLSKSHSESHNSPPVPTPPAHSTTSSTYTDRAGPPEISPSNSMSSTNESFSSYSLVSIPLGPNSSLQVSPEDRMNVFTNASFSMNLEGPIWQQHGTLSYIGLTKSDPFIKLFRNFTVLLLKTGYMSKFLMKERRKRKGESDETEKIGEKRLHLSNGKGESEKSEIDKRNLVAEDLLIMQKIVREDDEEEEEEDGEEKNGIPEPPSIKKNPISLFPGIESLYSSERTKQDYYRLVEKVIIEVLPCKMNLFILFSRFFKYVHPFIPIIDEHVLLMDVNSPLAHFPEFTKDYHKQITIRNDEDLRIMGILLLVMRLGYMSMIHNDSIYNNYNADETTIIQEMKSKLDSKTFVHVINLCISDGLLASRSSFKLVQLLTLLYFYRQITPDDSHGISGADSHILFGVIMRHAMAIGLNRDPTFYSTHESICNNAALCRTWRFLWHYLVVVDATSAIHTGTNLNLMNYEICDVQLPKYEKAPGLNKYFESLGAICKSYRNIVNKINNVSQKPKIVDILTETNHLEKLFFEIFGKDFFRDVVCKPAEVPTSPSGFDIRSQEHEDSLVKVLKYCMFIQLRTNLSGMYYMIAIHYENVYNQSKTPSMNAGIELFKIYIKSVVQLVYIISYVLDNSVELFGKNYDFFLTSQNERYMIKTHSFLTSFFVRLLHQKKDLSFQVYKDPKIQPRLNVIDNLFTMVLVEAELFVGNFRKLSRTYINSYRLYIITYIILRQCVENADVFFEKAMNDHGFFHHGTNMIEFFTVGELNRLCKLCGEFKTAKEQQEKLKQQRRLQQVVKPMTPAESFGYSTPGDISSLFFDNDDYMFENMEVKNVDSSFTSDDFLKLFDIYGDLKDHLT